MTQSIVVAFLVIACTLRAAWILAPAAARRPLARALLALALPSGIAKALRKHVDAASGCACDGCDRGSAAAKAPAPTAGANATPTIAPITFHRRLPR
jgi:hypothetical protein